MTTSVKGMRASKEIMNKKVCQTKNPKLMKNEPKRILDFKYTDSWNFWETHMKKDQYTFLSSSSPKVQGSEPLIKTKLSAS